MATSGTAMTHAAFESSSPHPLKRASGPLVEPVTPTIGAEISGVDLSRPLDAATLDGIQEALRQWRVIFFRDQELTND